MGINYKKAIGWTALFTFVAMLVSCIIMFVVLYFGFTKDLADFCYHLGNYSAAGNLYERVYKKKGDIYFSYLALTIDIKTEDYDGVVDNYEDFVADEGYNDFMVKISQGNQIVDGGILERSALINEYNYLQDKYISALIKLGDTDKAFDLAVTSFSDYANYSFKEQGYYSLHRFVTADTLDKFSLVYDGYSGTLIDNMQSYFDMALGIFESNEGSSHVVDKAYLLALGNRIILVGQNINSIYDGLDYNESQIAINSEKMVATNDFIKGLLQ